MRKCRVKFPLFSLFSLPFCPQVLLLASFIAQCCFRVCYYIIPISYEIKWFYVERGAWVKNEVRMKEKEEFLLGYLDAQTVHEKEIKINGPKWFYGFMMMELLLLQL